MAPAIEDNDVVNTTDVSVNFQEFRPNVAAYDAMTIFFIASALTMGFLLFFAIRKSVKISLVEYFYKVPKPQPPGVSIVWDVANINAGRLQERHGKRMLERAGVKDIHQQIKEDKKPRKLVLLNRRKGGIYFKNKSTLILGNSRIVKRLGFTPAVYLTSGMGENQRVESPTSTLIRQGQVTSVDQDHQHQTVIVEDGTEDAVDMPMPVKYNKNTRIRDTTSSSESIFLSFAKASVFTDSGLGDSLQQSSRVSSQTLEGTSSGRTYGRKKEPVQVRSLRELMHGPMDLKQRIPASSAADTSRLSDASPTKPKVPAISILHDYSPVPTPPPSPGLPPPPPLPAASYVPLYQKREQPPKVSSSGIFMEAERTPRSSVHTSIHALHRDDDEESVKTGSVVQFSNEVSRIDYEYPDESLPRGTRTEPVFSYADVKDDEDEDDQPDENEEEDRYMRGRFFPQDDQDILGHGGNNLPAVSEVLESDVVFQEMSVDEEGEQVLFITRL